MALEHEVCIGSISACIGGDTRYTTVVKVYASSTNIRICRQESGAVGGMDGPGGAFDNPEVDIKRFSRHDVSLDHTVAIVMTELRKVLKKDPTISRYGKPTKNFGWYVDGDVKNGLSLALLKQALEYAL